MIRPEVRALFFRFREVIAAGAVLCLGLWWSLRAAGLLQLLGPIVALAGAAILWLALQRLRFRRGGAGPGHVQVDEGQIVYFGPLSGGMVSLRELSHLVLVPGRGPAWRLHQPGQPPLVIPLDADGTDALFDAFASLPGLQTTRMLAQMKTKGTQDVVIWQRPGTSATDLPLH